MARPVNDVRHRQVLDAALTVIRDRGFEGATMGAIADVAGIPKSTLFHYVGSKDELVKLMQERLFEIARDELRAVADDGSRLPSDRLRALLQVHAHHCVERLSSPVLVAFAQRWGDPASERGGDEVLSRRRYETVFEETLQECVDAGEVAPRDTRTTAMGLIGMVTWMAFWYRPGTDPPVSVVVDGMLDMTFDGLRPRHTSGQAAVAVSEP